MHGTIDLSDRAWRSALAMRALANNTLLKLRMEEAMLGQKPDPLYENHLRGGLAMVDGIEKQATRVEHLRPVRPPRQLVTA